MNNKQANKIRTQKQEKQKTIKSFEECKNNIVLN